MAPLVEHECNAAKDHNRDINYGACDRLIYIGYYFAQLSKSGLWPTNQQPRKTSFVNIVPQSSKIKGYWNENVTPGSYSQYCSSPRIDVKPLTEQIAHNAIEGLK